MQAAFLLCKFALTHCTLADVISVKTVADQTVIIRDGIIAAIGASSGTPVQKEARVIDCTGKSLLPGYVLMHEHMYYPALSMNPLYVHYKQLPVTFPKLYLACGATMIRTAGSIEPYSDLALKRDIDLGKIAGPSMEITAPYPEGKGSFAPQLHELSGPGPIRSLCARRYPIPAGSLRTGWKILRMPGNFFPRRATVILDWPGRTDQSTFRRSISPI